ncbi:MAG: penicillin-binding protein 1C [Bacteroidia bacterium]
MLSKKRKRLLIVLAILGLGYAACLPGVLFDTPLSQVVVDRKGRLLGARIASDGQWRFPARDTAPSKFAQCIVTFEDKRFYSHPGVDPLAIGRAIRLNLKEGGVVSGGSTLSMQVIRLSRNNPARTYLEKVWEIILATRLEIRHSKSEILALYASHAPFGGNVVGLDAASWKYYGRPADRLSWAESATLAVLPNAPSLIHPGRNRNTLRKKRNFLLERLKEAGIIDAETAELAKLEPLPERPLRLPNLSPHLTARLQGEAKRSRAIVHTTIDANIQSDVNQIVARHYERLASNGINNAAVLVADVRTGAVRSYVGNTFGQNPDHGQAVDIIMAPRSTGSILKPFLYGAMLDDGLLLPRSLVPDIPSQYGAYTPQNYTPKYDGLVPADEALARSLNVPAVRMLERYGVARFQDKMKRLGISTLFRPASDYGLTLVLGGAEATLWDLAGAYASMGRSLDAHPANRGKSNLSDFRPLHIKPNFEEEEPNWTETPPLSPAAVWHAFNAMVELKRPDSEVGWREFASSRKLAWKTGTSYGFRDAWSIGCTPNYVVAVWVGNADGEGRPGIVGVQAAAPLMFDVFNVLSANNAWFAPPYDNMRYLPTCTESGLRVGRFCPKVDTLWVPEAGERVSSCTYHKPVRLDAKGEFRINDKCYPPLAGIEDTFFIVPPLEASYYRKQKPSFRPLPAWYSGCNPQQQDALVIIYPKPKSRVYVPLEIDGETGRVVLEANHRDREAILYWHIDDVYIGKTQGSHLLAVKPAPGKHTLSVVDEQGTRAVRKFVVLGKGDE